MTNFPNIGKANLAWEQLGFSYTKTPYRFRAYYKDGQWSAGEILADNVLHISEGSTALNYGQAAFEGLKAFATQDNQAVLFRPDMNARRMAHTAQRLMMPEVPAELFIRAAQELVSANIEYLPPFGSKAALYLRPLLIGVGDNLGVQPAREYIFTIFCSPTGPYFSNADEAVKLIVFDDYDRAASHGIGHVKASANYAATLQAKMKAKAEGFGEVLYLDTEHHKYIEETGASNFFVIKDNLFVTPRSPSILEGITRLSLIDIAKEMGMTVEHRPLALSEISDFDEAGCCGTAAVLAPVSLVQHGKQCYQFEVGEQTRSHALKQQYQAVQHNQSERQEKFKGWLTFV